VLRLTALRRLCVVCFALSITACASYSSVDGVDNVWREVPIEEFEVGVTTQSEVLERLGPPSQLIGLDDKIVLYYLSRRNSGQGKIFIIWNDVRETNQYDRAIFFFDTAGILTEVAYSNEAIER
jgi:hypothetical protein